MARASGRPAGRRRSGGPIGVIDIGSNSIRLVVFERARRAALPMFNEKVMCGLGRGLDASGRLSEEGARSALTNLARFVRLAEAMDVTDLSLLGTAAVRDAANGAEFAAEVERRTGRPVQVLSGAEEARLSALGVVSGIVDADGLMGDLGGGSLELVALDHGRLGAHVTLPIGPLRLMDMAGGDVHAAKPIVDKHLGSVDWLRPLAERSFYPVGGAWRTLARIHMGQTHYPLHVIQQYAVQRQQAEEMCRLVGRLGRRTLLSIGGISRRRIDILPFAALVLERLLRLTKPRDLVFSALGLREGYHYSRLSPAERRKDPLIAACSDLAATHNRFGVMGERLHAWLDPLFADDSEAQRRLRLAACLLSDIAWREHPDYRARAATSVLHLPLTGITHAERVWLALTIAARYGGPEGDDLRPMQAMLPEEERQRAIAVGLAMRLGYLVSGATPVLLESTALSTRDGRLALLLPRGGAIMHGEAVQRRLEALGRAVGRPVQVAEVGLERKAS